MCQNVIKSLAGEMMAMKSKIEDLFVCFTKLCIQGCAKAGLDSLMRPASVQSLQYLHSQGE